MNKRAEDEKLNVGRNVNEFSEEKSRKIPLRKQYLLEKDKIIAEIGDLDLIRLRIGLSQRRICQLLLMDPSAWTRWVKSKSGPPPHVYQALKWLLELKNINPDVVQPSDLNKRVDHFQIQTADRIESLESQMQNLDRTIQFLSQAGQQNLEQQIDELKMQIHKLALQNMVRMKSTAAPTRKRRKKGPNKNTKAIKKRSLITQPKRTPKTKAKPMNRLKKTRQRQKVRQRGRK